MADESSESGWSRSASVAIGVGILVVGILGFLALLWGRPAPGETSEPARGVWVEVARVHAVAEQPVPVQGEGLVRPRIEVVVAAQVAGEVRSVHDGFVSGGRVRRGERLVRLDPRDARNRVRQARATVAQREVDARLATGRSEVARTTADRLADEGLEIPPEDQPAGELVARVPQRRAADAALDAARAQLDDAELALSRTTIEAPFDGVVRDVSVGVGSYVAPGQRVGTLMPADFAEIEVALSREEARRIPELFAGPEAETERVAAEVQVGPEVRSGFLDRAELGLDPTAHTVTAIVRVEDPFDFADSGRDPLLVDQIVTVTLDGRRVDEALVVPGPAIRWAGGARVWRVDRKAEEGPRIYPVDVEVLYEDGAAAWVRSPDLSEGDEVVRSSLAAPTAGTRVRVADEEGGA